jgi:hypothetical protein
MLVLCSRESIEQEVKDGLVEPRLPARGHEVIEGVANNR